MRDWSQPGAGRPAGSEAEQRDPNDTVPDPAEPSPEDEPAEWDELTPAGTVRLTPPTDVLVAGAPLAEPGRPVTTSGQLAGGQGTATPTTGGQPGTGGAPSGTGPAGAGPAGGVPTSGSQLSGSHLSGSQSARPTQLTDRPAPDAGAGAEPGRRGGAKVLDSAAADGFHARWREVQYGFVDDPRDAVRRADDLADEVLTAFTDALTAHKRALDERWRTQQATPQDTERLRLLIRAYREFVDRLLTT